MGDQRIQPVPQKFVGRGIEKYEGEVDEALRRHLQRAGSPFIPWCFKDGRYLLVQPDTGFGFLYPDKEAVYEKLVLE